MVDDPLVRHEHLSQRDEELMHFMEGKFQLDFYCTTPESQHHVEDALGYLLHQIGGIGEAPPPRPSPAAGEGERGGASAPRPACGGGQPDGGEGRRRRNPSMKVRIDYAICNSCGLCREVCPESAIRPKLLEPRHLYEVQPEKCTGCGECLDYCPAPGALVQIAA